MASYNRRISSSYSANSSLPPMQARRVHARYMLGMKVKDIAAMEGTGNTGKKSVWRLLQLEMLQCNLLHW